MKKYVLLLLLTSSSSILSDFTVLYERQMLQNAIFNQDVALVKKHLSLLDKQKASDFFDADIALQYTTNMLKAIERDKCKGNFDPIDAQYLAKQTAISIAIAALTWLSTKQIMKIWHIVYGYRLSGQSFEIAEKNMIFISAIYGAIGIGISGVHQWNAIRDVYNRKPSTDYYYSLLESKKLLENFLKDAPRSWTTT